MAKIHRILTPVIQRLVAAQAYLRTSRQYPNQLQVPGSSHPQQPVVITSHSIFSDHDDLKANLTKLDNVWRTGVLFSKIEEPDSNFYRNYLIDLTNVVINSHKFLAQMEGETSLDLSTKFEHEYIAYAERDDLSLLQKAIDLTRAVELRLLGADVPPLLKVINSNGGSQSSGYRQELQAGWLYAKLNCLNGDYNFQHSVTLSTIRRNKKKEDYGQWIEKEVDILTSKSIISVKSTKKSYAEQIRNLFYIIMDDKKFDLKTRINRIVLIKNAENEKQLSLGYLHSQGYRDFLDRVVLQAKESIREWDSLDLEKEKLFRKLITNQNIEFYFTPIVNGSKNNQETIDNWRLMEKWIQGLYSDLDKAQRDKQLIA